jgi:hypothetical protein
MIFFVGFQIVEKRKGNRLVADPFANGINSQFKTLHIPVKRLEVDGQILII